MRVVFVNLHSDWMLVKSASVYIFRFSPAIKHGYLLRYLLNHPEYEICNYINDRGFSTLRNDNELLMKILNVFRFAENKKTMKVNGIDLERITIIKDASDIRPDDLVILYNICKDNYREMSNVDAFKALSMLHFHGKASENEIIDKANVSCLFNEVNLDKNCELYRRYYHVDKPWVIHPFVYAERFQNKTPFSERKNMAFATGTITYKEHEEFLSTYGDACDQPSRKQIKDNPEFFKDTVYCTSSDYLEDNPGKIVKSIDILPVKLYKKIYNRLFTGKQKTYYSFDMVEAFNSYKMCVVGEEILGIPGIGFVEGMACGCAYIGIDSPAYRDWGLVPGVHYITYDGSKEDLRRVIEYYQMDEHQEELEKIAETGYKYVRDNFNGETVAANLMKELEEKQKRWLGEKGKNRMKKLHLIMPMGGAGSRFFENGFDMPKPLIEINKMPFLYWATRSIEKYVELTDITFVVLKQHIEEFKIDQVILRYFPTAKIEVVDFEEVKSGPVMTCLAGLKNIHDDQPILFNDCDHMFSCDSFSEDMNNGDWNYDGALLTFESDQPQFSYIQYEDGKVIGTVEKKVVSNHAICGAYVVRNAQMFRDMAEEYLKHCNYSEFFVSGIYNVMCENGYEVKNYTVDFHVPFGTPTEYESAQNSKYFDELL